MVLLSNIHTAPPFWLVIPFVSLLLMIATGPLFFPKVWHHYYKHIAVGIGTLVTAYYLLVFKQPVLVGETLAE